MKGTNVYNWYIIPGFSSYDMNINTKDIRSHKHYKRDLHHIMKVSDQNTVTVTDDAGTSKRMNVDELYDLTFNKGYELRPRSDNASFRNGMVKSMRYMEGNVTGFPNSSIPHPILGHAPILCENKNDGYIILDFTKIVEPTMIKPFTIDYDSLKN